MSSQSQPTWLTAGPFRYIPGHAFGRKQPTLEASVIINALMSQENTECLRVNQENLIEALREVVKDQAVLSPPPLSTDGPAWTGYAAQAAVALLRCAGLPVVDSPVMIPSDRHDQSSADLTRVMLPVLPGIPRATRQAWLLALEFINRAVGANESAALISHLRNGLESIQKMVPTGSNTPRLLAAAFEMDIPIFSLGMGIFQFGQGRRAEWMESTFTLKTSNISARLARNKLAAAARLRQAGLPVPAHHLVVDIDEAVRVASKMGYPVVVKPADLDGGKGVSAGLESEVEVRAAYDRARSVSRSILVEKHFHGRDHRLTVMDGRLIWSIERVPAGVTGDGIQTVMQLVAQENTNSKRNGPNPPLKKIILDEDALQLLDKVQLMPESIPLSGQFVALRRIANIEAGGKPVAVNDRVHPDNAQLAVRAAQALRLDLAGIDLLIPDITRSWREVGAAICEVNAQPQLGATTGPHLYGQILRERLEGDGRIPSVLVVGDHESVQVAHAIERQLQALGMCVGYADARGGIVDGEWIVRGSDSLFQAGVALLTHPHVDALVLNLEDLRMLKAGLPVDRIDWLVLAGNGEDLARKVLPLLLPSCAGRLVDLVGDGQLLRQSNPQWPLRTVSSMNLESLLSAMAADLNKGGH